MKTALALLLLTGTASAARVVVRGDSACPSVAQVEAALRATVPELQLGEPADLTVELADEGASFSAKLGDDVRRFDDPARACGERATKIAVVVALDVEAAPEPPPPAVVSTTPPPTPSPPPPRAPVRFDRAFHWPDVELEAVARLALAPAQHASTTGGGGLRAFIGARHVGLIVGLMGLSPTTLSFDRASATLWRVPIDVGARGRVFAGRFTFSLDAALVLAPQITEGMAVMNAARQTRVELGLEVIGRAELWATSRVAPFLEVGYEGIPRAYDFTLPSLGTVGHTPQSWLMLGAGLAVKLR